MPPPASALTRRNERRSTGVLVSMNASSVGRFAAARTDWCRRVACCLMNGRANAKVRRTSTDVAVHGSVDLLVRRIRRLREERGGRHQLASLTVAALRNVELFPGFLQRMRSVG